MAYYEIGTDYSGRITSIRECFGDDGEPISLPAGLSLALFYIIGLIIFITMAVNLFESFIPFWPVVLVIGLLFAISPILLFITLFLPKKAVKIFASIIKKLLHFGYCALIMTEIYLAVKIGSTPTTVAICVLCMYGMFYFFILLVAQCFHDSIFSLIYTWLAVPASFILFLFTMDKIGDLGPVLFPFYLMCSYFIHSIIKFILSRFDIYGDNIYFDTWVKRINIIFLIIYSSLFFGFVIWAATL